MSHNCSLVIAGVSRAVDLCAAPGSWSQVLSREIYGAHKAATATATAGGGDVEVSVTDPGDVVLMAPSDASADVELVAASAPQIVSVDLQVRRVVTSSCSLASFRFPPVVACSDAVCASLDKQPALTLHALASLVCRR